MAVSETIVREYFELHGFLVRQHRKHVGVHSRDDDEVDFYVQNPQVRPGKGPLPFVLRSEDMCRLERAVVVVKAYHTETFSVGVLAKIEPEKLRFLEPAVFQRAVKFFGGTGTVSKLLIVPALPEAEAGRQKSIELLRAKGVDAVIPFRTLLADLIARTEKNRNYQKSDLLQVIRLLKLYDLVKGQQMELFKPRRRKVVGKGEAPAGPPSGVEPGESAVGG